jgi:glutathionylspermidine synthase
MTVSYLMDVASQAGIESVLMRIDDIGWDEPQNCFVDLTGRPIRSIFKLYPWEWLVRDQYANQLLSTYTLTQWIEPIWKMLLSNKAILPVLWEMFEGHPNLLAAYDAEDPRAPSRLKQSFVRKPKLSREGANVALVRDGQSVAEAPGGYGEEGFILQEIAPIPTFDGHHPVLGVWIVNHEACGLGIREDQSLITSNLSRFVPHLF